jgi:hypothetical protein
VCRLRGAAHGDGASARARETTTTQGVDSSRTAKARVSTSRRATAPRRRERDARRPRGCTASSERFEIRIGVASNEGEGVARSVLARVERERVRAWKSRDDDDG